MESKINKQLAEAKALFYAWRMGEAYNVFRRYFDRLPFRPEKEHAEYVGIFARILCELGKEYELKFYMGELERHYEKSRDPYIAYPLAVIYTYIAEPRMAAAKTIFEDILKNPSANEWHGKAKMQLARYYDNVGDGAACRALIESIQTSDPEFQVLVDIWKAKILRDEKKFDESEVAFLHILETLTSDVNWYAYFSAKLGLAMVYVARKEAETAQEILRDVRELFKGRHFKTVQEQLDRMDKLVEEKLGVGTIRVKANETESQFSYGGKSLTLKLKTPGAKLLLLLIKKRFLDKAMIVKNLYERQYNGEQDDKLIYYHIHALRKRLKILGLPSDAISNEDNGYRLVPTVEFA